MKNLFNVLLVVASISPAVAGDVLEAMFTETPPPRTVETAKLHRFDQGFELTDAGEVRTVRAEGEKRRSGSSWAYVPVKGEELAAFTVEAEGFNESMGGGEALIYVDIAYADGTALYGQKAWFDLSMKAAWHGRRVPVMPDRPVKSANIYLMTKGGAGAFRFRNLALRVYGGAGDRFDSVSVKRGDLPPGPLFLLRDVDQGGFAVIQPGGEAKGVKLAVKETAENASRLFDVTLSSSAGGDRALTLVYALPLEAGEITWHSSLRKCETLKEDSGERFSAGHSPCGTGLLSKWPLGAAAAGGCGEALGINPEAPAVFHLGVNPRYRRLFIAFDVALTPEKPTAHFGFVRHSFPAADGLRGALAAYREVFPESFKVRTPKQGIWMAFRKISTVPNPEDFGFAFKEGDNETKWDDEHGYITFRYTEPTTWWMSIGGKDGRKYATFDECEARAEELVKKGDKMALGWKASAMKGENGNPLGRILDTPWCNGIVWNVNSAPDLPGGDFTVKNGEPTFSNRFKGEFPAGLDGEYVDSAEMYVTDDFDFDRAHFSSMRTPLAWRTTDHRPAIYKGMIAYEYVRALAEKVHAKGRLMMANGVPSRWCWQIPYIDVTGTETDWNPKGKWRPTSDDQLIYQRALAGGKPYCFLMNTDFSKFGYVETEKFMQRALAYGMFPGFFSQSATSRQGAHYFDHPEYYNVVRPLFKKYVPLCRKVNEAEWRPLNRLLASDNPQVIAEQFGDSLVTVFNLSDKPQTVKLAAKGRAEELVAGGEWDFTAGSKLVEMPPETVRVLEFK